MSKRLVELFAKVAGQKVGECGNCGGEGRIRKLHDGCVLAHGYGPRCPLCTRFREIRDRKWHTITKKKDKWKCTCGDGGTVGESSRWHLTSYVNANPTFTVQSVRTLLEDIGEWGEGWEEGKFQKWLDDININKLNVPNGLTKYDILTSDPLMTEAATAYLEGK